MLIKNINVAGSKPWPNQTISTAMRTIWVSTIFALSGCSLWEASQLSNDIARNSVSFDELKSLYKVESTETSSRLLFHARTPSPATISTNNTVREFANDYRADVDQAYSEMPTKAAFRLGKKLLENSANDNDVLTMTLSVAGIVGLYLSDLDEDKDLLNEDALSHTEDLEKSDVWKQYGGQIRSLAETGDPSDFSPTTSRDDWIKFNRIISDATISRAWASAAVVALGQAFAVFHRCVTSGDADYSSDDLAILQTGNIRSLLYSYYRAYFRNGEIFVLNFDATGVKDDLVDRLKRDLTEQQLKAVGGDIDKLIEKLRKELCGDDPVEKCISFGVHGESTFMTRAGKSYGFPGITATIDPIANKKISTNKINRKGLTVDLVRILWEGVGDGVFQVPGVANSTICQRLATLCAKPNEAKQIAWVNDYGDRAEGTVMSVTSVFIRGGWILSLNNETLADLIEVSAGVIARKKAEKSAWDSVQASCKLTPETVPVQLLFTD